MDDLVKRLRGEDCANCVQGVCVCDIVEQAADRIEQLQKQTTLYFHAFNKAMSRIEALKAALAHIYAWYPISVTQPRQTIDDIREFAKAALEEKKDD